jgi:hypothetical protein
MHGAADSVLAMVSVSKVKFSAVVANIADVVADVFVVSANTFLDFEGGAAEALRGSCEEVAEAVFAQQRATVAVGDVVVTGAGRRRGASSIFWAVVRDYRDVAVNDEARDTAALQSTWPRVWRLASTVSTATTPASRVRVAVVPLGAADVGFEASIELLVRSFVGVPLVHALDILICVPDEARLQVARRVFLDLKTAARSAAPGPVEPPPMQTPTTPATRPVEYRKRALSERLRVDVLSHCQGAPVGCGGALIRVRATDVVRRVRVVGDTIDEIALDAVRVDPISMIVTLGAHMLSFITKTAGPFTVTMEALNDPGRRVMTTCRWSASPPAGWRGLDFDDSGWRRHELNDPSPMPAGAACRSGFSMKANGNFSS